MNGARARRHNASNLSLTMVVALAPGRRSFICRPHSTLSGRDRRFADALEDVAIAGATPTPWRSRRRLSRGPRLKGRPPVS
jgi:hypothetical protein